MAITYHSRDICSIDQCEDLIRQFSLEGVPADHLQSLINDAFHDYIILALSEEVAESREERTQVYVEAIYHLEKAAKLLFGEPHPAHGMALKLNRFIATLKKITESKEADSQERASRFMERNLARNLKKVWTSISPKPFSLQKNPDQQGAFEFLRACFDAARDSHPEISWFQGIDNKTISLLMKSVLK